MLELVPNPFKDEGRGFVDEMIPRFFVEVSGKRTPAKMELSNRALVDWQVAVKKVRKVNPEKECPFYSPSTQNLELRTCLGLMKDLFDFRFKLGDFDKFPGSLAGVMAAVYKQRTEEYVSEKIDF